MHVIINSGSFFFDLVRTIRVSVHVINSLNQISLIASLKVINLTAIQNRVEA
jgi:hypothetical protein